MIGIYARVSTEEQLKGFSISSLFSLTSKHSFTFFLGLSSFRAQSPFLCYLLPLLLFLSSADRDNNKHHKAIFKQIKNPNNYTKFPQPIPISSGVALAGISLSNILFLSITILSIYPKVFLISSLWQRIKSKHLRRQSK
ncbi:Uncharacterised protein [Niallia circulans]|nr:Uncharacterised protein [Niallia circulans]